MFEVQDGLYLNQRTQNLPYECVAFNSFQIFSSFCVAVWRFALWFARFALRPFFATASHRRISKHVVKAKPPAWKMSHDCVDEGVDDRSVVDRSFLISVSQFLK